MRYESFSFGQQAPKKLREKIWGFENDWQRDICGCCNDIGSCMYFEYRKKRRFLIFDFVFLLKGFCAYFCCPCFCCQVYNRAGEWVCTPFFCCWPDSLMSLRMKIRTGFRLQVKN